MQALLRGFPQVHVLAYASEFPDTLHEVVQKEVNDKDDAYHDSVNIDFWDGLTSVDGFGSVHFLNALFYKTTHLAGGNWDHAYTYQYNTLFAMLSRELSNWGAVADRVFESPFVWISAGGSSFEAARPPSFVGDQLDAARRWGMNRMFANYTYDTINSFDYDPYLPSIRAAAKPGVVDKSPPRLSIDPLPATVTGETVSVTGIATDNLAIRFVRWRTDTGQTGTATLNWDATGSPRTGWDWRMKWSVADIPLRPGTNTIEFTVEDIKGLAASTTSTISR